MLILQLCITSSSQPESLKSSVHLSTLLQSGIKNKSAANAKMNCQLMKKKLKCFSVTNKVFIRLFKPPQINQLRPTRRLTKYVVQNRVLGDYELD
ncbi:unnamed protein product [Lupinus luteus]|uniref:Uncharacterized protein n=1 Tax=Lupinus luteus TaxID=3873 RepID=A0AAV1YM74_LUPLU